jgi:predicted metal-dependent hydrolase
MRKRSADLVTELSSHPMGKHTTERQRSLNYGDCESSLKNYLEERLGRPITLVLTENSTTMLSARVQNHVLRVRLHRMFANAGRQVLDEIASYLNKRKPPMPLFRNFLRENKTEIKTKPLKTVHLKTVGKYHDLRDMYDTVNKEYFGGLINAEITWGTRSPRSSVRRRTLGSYSERSDIIRINPVLDRKTVPPYFVAFIIYHEMLHASLGAQLKGTRRSVHSREFRKKEKLFKDYEKALIWEGGKACAGFPTRAR